MNKTFLALAVATAALAGAPALAAPCTGISLGNSSTDDVRLSSVDSDACQVSSANPHQFDGNSSGFSGAFGGNAWSVLAGTDVNAVNDIGPFSLGGVNFAFSLTKTTATTGTWSIKADQNVQLDLVLAIHGANRSGAFLFDDEVLSANVVKSGTWTIEWLNNGAQVPNFSNSVLFARDPASQIPEPGTYSLMLAGLAAVGFISRRRKISRV